VLPPKKIKAIHRNQTLFLKEVIAIVIKWEKTCNYPQKAHEYGL
jgi:hypothetical protein